MKAGRCPGKAGEDLREVATLSRFRLWRNSIPRGASVHQEPPVCPRRSRGLLWGADGLLARPDDPANLARSKTLSTARFDAEAMITLVSKPNR